MTSSEPTEVAQARAQFAHATQARQQAARDLLAAVAAQVQRSSGHAAIRVAVRYDLTDVECVGGARPRPLSEVAPELDPLAVEAAHASGLSFPFTITAT